MTSRVGGTGRIEGWISGTEGVVTGTECDVLVSSVSSVSSGPSGSSSSTLRTHTSVPGSRRCPSAQYWHEVPEYWGGQTQISTWRARASRCRAAAELCSRSSALSSLIAPILRGEDRLVSSNVFRRDFSKQNHFRTLVIANARYQLFTSYFCIVLLMSFNCCICLKRSSILKDGLLLVCLIYESQFSTLINNHF